MNKEDLKYLNLILFHAGIGFLVFIFPFFAKIYGYAIFILGAYIIVKTQNKRNEALMVAAYVVGSEVFLRMTGGSPLYESGKYGVMIFIFSIAPAYLQTKNPAPNPEQGFYNYKLFVSYP